MAGKGGSCQLCTAVGHGCVWGTASQSIACDGHTPFSYSPQGRNHGLVITPHYNSASCWGDSMLEIHSPLSHVIKSFSSLAEYYREGKHKFWTPRRTISSQEL